MRTKFRPWSPILQIYFQEKQYEKAINTLLFNSNSIFSFINIIRKPSLFPSFILRKRNRHRLLPCTQINRNDYVPFVSDNYFIRCHLQPVAQYDVYFPGKLIPMWLFVIYTVLTFGLFLVYYYCNLWFISKGCCLPTNLEFSRGRLMVTNKDRIIVWKADFNQVRVPAHFKCLWQNENRVGNVSQSFVLGVFIFI